MSSEIKNENVKSESKSQAIIIGIALLVFPFILEYADLKIPSIALAVFGIWIRWWAISPVCKLLVAAGRNEKLGYWAIVVPGIMLIVAGSLGKRNTDSSASHINDKIASILLLLLFLSYESIGQIKTFKQLSSLVTSDVPTMRKLLRFENYSYGYTKEFYEHLVCEVWLHKGTEKSKNAYCMCKYYDDYPMYMYLDSTLNFLQNSLVEIDKMGYKHSDDSKYQYYEKGDKYLLLTSFDGIYLYWLSNTKETLAMMYLLGSTKDKK